VRPDEYILAVLSPEERLDAALRVAREAFKGATLTIEEVEAAVRRVRRRRYAPSARSRSVVLDTNALVSAFAFGGIPARVVEDVVARHDLLVSRALREKRLQLCRDPGDNMLLDVCLAGRADVLVTGDADLLTVDAEQLRAVGTTRRQ